MTEASAEATAARETVLAWCGRNRHFLVAAVLLAASAAGWSALVEVVGIATWKAPVPWPDGVSVDDEFRMTSLPDRLGPFEWVRGDGELERDVDGKPVRDGRPDGDVILRDDLMESLHIGTVMDKANRPKRRSNWFLVRRYRDGRRPRSGGSTYKYWSAEAYYYTGGVDPVPHVPEICLYAGGARAIRPTEVPVHIPSLPAPWNQPFKLRRVLYEVARQGITTQMAQYYVFSLNGRPTNSRYTVRWELTSPFVRHAYFAKIQFSPIAPVHDPELTDEAAREFARHYLPAVLKVMAMPKDVDALSTDG